MSKTGKRSTANTNRKLTDFFHQRSGGFSSSQPASQSPLRSQPALSSSKLTPLRQSQEATQRKTVPPRSDQEIISISSDNTGVAPSDVHPHVSVSTDSISKKSVVVISDTSEDLRPTRTTRRKAMAVEPLKPLRPQAAALVAARSSTKRRRSSRISSSALQACITPNCPPRLNLPTPKPPMKRKQPFESDSDAEPATEVVKVPDFQLFPTVPPPSRKSRKETPVSPEIVPSPVVEFREAVMTTSSKKIRLTPPSASCPPPSSGEDADVEDLVPSSQSDEQELVMPKDIKKDPVQVKESVDRWRKDALAHSPSRPPSPNLLDIDFAVPITDIQVDPDDRMDVDANLPRSVVSTFGSGMQTPKSEAEVSILLHWRESPSASSSARTGDVPLPAVDEDSVLTRVSTPFGDSDAFRALTPPPTSDPIPIPPTPEALTEESKTARIVAQIRAAALAAVESSPEPSDFNDELNDSSSEESDSFMFETLKGKAKAPVTPQKRLHSPSPFGSPLSNLPSSRHSRNSSPQHVSAPYNFRRLAVGDKRKVRIIEPMKPLELPSRKRAVHKYDPVKKLLKEKQLADRKGKGMEAFLAAEASLKVSEPKFDPKTVTEDGEDETDGHPDWLDEDAAMRVVAQDGPSTRSASVSMHEDANDSDSDSESESLEAEDCNRILGAKGGKEVGKILASDRRIKRLTNGKRKVSVIGVPLWETKTGVETMETVFEVPSLPTCTDNAILKLLQDAVDEKEYARLNLFFNSSLLEALNHEHSAIILPWLFELVSTAPDPLGVSSFNALHQLSSTPMHPRPASGFSFAVILSSLVSLGAKPTIFETFGRDIPSQLQTRDVHPMRRTVLIDRLILLVTAFAQNGALPVRDVPDTLLALLLVALDTSTTPELGRAIIYAIEVVGRTIPSADFEAAAYDKILKFGRNLTPVNKVRLVSFLVGASPQMARITRAVARGLLLPSHASYSALPPLSPLLDLLTPSPGAEVGAFFDVQGNSDKTGYYDDLTHHIELLSMGLTDIDAYIREDFNNPPGEVANKDTLERIKDRLEHLHGRIPDTRAAHLDRSRAKAALQRLAHRLHYQRTATLKSGGTGKPTLAKYFGKPRPKK